MDVLGAIYEARGKRKPPRASADRSIRTTGHLLDYDAGSWLATVSVHNSAPISGVPATPADYVGLGITTVSVLLDPETGRPVQVLGPASDVAVGGAGGIAPPPGAGGARIVRGRVFLPVDTGTWDTDAEAWDTISSYGGVTDARQETSAGPNLIPNPEPLPVELEEDGYSSYIGSGWSDNGSYGNQWRILTDFGPEGASDSCYRGIFQFSVGDWRIFATDAGASAPAVAAGTYRVTFHAQTESYDEGIAVLAGVIWYDGSGDVISTSLGDPVALEANGDPGPRWYTPSDPEYDYSPPSIWAGNTAYVQSDFTAPEGAAHARPFSQWDLPSGADTDYCLMSAAYLGVLS